MSKYERIRREIIAVERDIVLLRSAVKKEEDRMAIKIISEKNQRIRENFSAIMVSS